MRHHTFLAAVLIAALSAAPVRAEEAFSNQLAIAHGLEKATLVISGTVQGYAAGGGGATGRIKVDEIFMGNESLKGTIIAVYWLTAKASMKERNLWFLVPQGQGYQETSGTNFPFVEATPENIDLLLSCLPGGQKPTVSNEVARPSVDPARPPAGISKDSSIARTIILRMRDPFYMRAYLGFIPFIFFAGYGILLVWKAFTHDTSPLVPRWVYFVGGVLGILTLPAYALFLKHQGLL